MTLHFSLNLYWLLLPLFVGLYFWVFIEREDERGGGWFSGIEVLFRLPIAAFIFLVALLVLVTIHLNSR